MTVTRAVGTVERRRATDVVRTVRDGAVGAARDLIWADLSSGVIRLRGLTPGLATVVVVSSAILVAGVAVLVASQAVRSSVGLVVLAQGTPGRGSLVPALVLPITLLLLAVSCALVLAGALHAHRWMRLTVATAYVAIGLSVQAFAFSSFANRQAAGWVALACLVAVPVTFAARWRAAPRPATEFVLLLGLVVVPFALVMQDLTALDRLSRGTSLAAGQVGLLAFNLLGIAIPLLIVAGLDVVEFGATASGWALRWVDQSVHRRAVLAGLVLLGGWRLRDLLVEASGDLDGGAGAAARRWAGAALVLAVVWSVWRLVDHLADRAVGDEADDGDITGAARSMGLPLALGYQSLTIAMLLLLIGAQALTSLVGVGATGVLEAVQDVLAFSSDHVVEWWRTVVSASALTGGVLLARSGNRGGGLFVALVGAIDLVGQLTTSGRPLDVLFTDEAALDLVWVLSFCGLGAYWAVRRRLTEARAERLFFILLLTALLRQGGFVSDPFSFLAFAGAGYVAFGILWGFLTAGSWANEDSPGLPRSARLYLFLGYSIFSLTLLNWFVLGHDVEQASSLTERYPSFGQALLGQPLLYSMFAVVLVGAVRDRPIELGDAGAAEAEAADELDPGVRA